MDKAMPLFDRDFKVVGYYPSEWPFKGPMPPALLRVKAPKTKAGKNKNGGPDRLFVFGEPGSYSEVVAVDFEPQRPMVSYAHRRAPKSKERFVQYANDPLPAWAVDVRPHLEPQP